MGQQSSVGREGTSGEAEESRARASSGDGTRARTASEDDDSSGEDSGSNGDDDSVASCRSVSATITRYESSASAPGGIGICNIFSALGHESLWGVSEDEEDAEGPYGDDGKGDDNEDKASTRTGPSGTSSPEEEGVSNLAAGLQPPPAPLFEQLHLLPSRRVVAEEGLVTSHAGKLRELLERVAGIVGSDGEFDVRSGNTQVLKGLVEYRGRETEPRVASPRADDVYRATRAAPSSRVGDHSQPEEDREQTVGERSPLPLSGHAAGMPVIGPSKPTECIEATRRAEIAQLGHFIGGFRSSSLGRHPKRIDRRASPSPAAPTDDEQCEAAVPAPDD